jgi:effector-binding domain-containing protein
MSGDPLSGDPMTGHPAAEGPRIIERAEQRYVGISATASMQLLGDVMPPLFPEVIGWVEDHGISPAGPAFCKYDVIDMATQLTIEVGVPTAETVEADSRVRYGVLPAGRYATVVHVGHPDSLEQATRELLAWAESSGLEWDSFEADDGEHWAGRLEFYLSDPAEEPDMNKWRTELAFLLKDGSSFNG